MLVLKSLTSLGLVFVLLLASCSVGLDPSITPTAADSATTTDRSTAVVESDDADPVIGPDSPAPAGPTEIGASKIELYDQDEVNTSYTGFALTLDHGTGWALPVIVPVPEGWVYQAEPVGFTNGTSSIMLTTGCNGECVPKPWELVLEQRDNFLDSRLLTFVSDGDGVRGGGGGHGGEISGRAYSQKSAEDGSGHSRTAHYHYEGARFLGCEARSAPGDVNLATLTEFCRSIRPDWTTVVASSPEAVIDELLSESAAAIIANPAPGLARQTVPIDDDGLSVDLALPDGATFEVDNFGTDVDLGDGWSVFTAMEVDATCSGLCGPRDWQSKLNRMDETIARRRFRLELDNDSPIASGWLQSGRDGDGRSYFVRVVRWNNDADRYFLCDVELAQSDADRAEEALGFCLSAEPSWLDT